MDDESILSPKDIENLQNAFNKYDKSNAGRIKPTDIADVFRMAGQNPTNAEVESMIQEADEPGTGMLMFSDMLPIVEKYWRNYENYAFELKEACLAFDRKDMGIIEFEDLKAVLMKYGEQMDEDEMKLFEKSMNVSDGKIIVDEFIKSLSPMPSEKSGKTKSKKAAGKNGGKKTKK